MRIRELAGIAIIGFCFISLMFWLWPLTGTVEIDNFAVLGMKDTNIFDYGALRYLEIVEFEGRPPTWNFQALGLTETLGITAIALVMAWWGTRIILHRARHKNILPNRQ
jgi:hypothetical protein